jgi:GTP-binding protein Era
MAEIRFKSGFVNIIGNPNVGKSTLMNALMQDRISIITSKPQTTRHRILGILSEDHYQVIFSDSPGLIQTPHYELQRKMNSFAYSSFEDADILIFVTDIFEKYSGVEKVITLLQKTDLPKFLIINKTDLDKDNTATKLVDDWNKNISFNKTFTLSALNNIGIDELRQTIIDALPEGPEYYPKDQLTDKPERFFVSEIIRENILLQYKQEIPYSCEVVVEEFKPSESRSGQIIRIRAVIYVDRKTQKAILIGQKGQAIKQLGTASRQGIESFFNKHVFLDLQVNVKEGWRDADHTLKHFGYNG